MKNIKSFIEFLRNFFARRVDPFILPFLLLTLFFLVSSYLFFFYMQMDDSLLSGLFKDVTGLFYNLFIVTGLFLALYYSYRSGSEQKVDMNKNWQTIKDLPEKYDVDLVARMVKLEYRIKRLETESLTSIAVYAFMAAAIIAAIISIMSITILK